MCNLGLRKKPLNLNNMRIIDVEELKNKNLEYYSCVYLVFDEIAKSNI